MVCQIDSQSDGQVDRWTAHTIIWSIMKITVKFLYFCPLFDSTHWKLRWKKKTFWELWQTDRIMYGWKGATLYVQGISWQGIKHLQHVSLKSSRVKTSLILMKMHVTNDTNCWIIQLFRKFLAGQDICCYARQVLHRFQYNHWKFIITWSSLWKHIALSQKSIPLQQVASKGL